MKKTIKTFAILVTLITFTSIASCGSPKVINGKHYDTYGLINKDDIRNPNIRYEVSYGNVFWSIVLVETIIAPIYFFGFSLYNPIEPK
jgi:hypothetical protein